jgi:hypothetical protein
MWRLYPRIMAVTVTPETLHRLIREAEAERGRIAAPTLKRAFAQLAAAYALQLERSDAPHAGRTAPRQGV